MILSRGRPERCAGVSLSVPSSVPACTGFQYQPPSIPATPAAKMVLPIPVSVPVTISARVKMPPPLPSPSLPTKRSHTLNPHSASATCGDAPCHTCRPVEGCPAHRHTPTHSLLTSSPSYCP